ncbi:MAG TPA: type II toxin-antitoxin system RelE/ParE family toxin [Myxococcaceae bacterium]|jgi:hypothetical protein
MASIEIIASDEFVAWYDSLDDRDAEAVNYSVDLLAELGVALDHPHSSAIKSAGFALRELRCQSGGRPLRVFYAFDPLRQAVLLIGGDKTGDGRFYKVMIPRASAIWHQHLEEQRAGLHPGPAGKKKDDGGRG